MLSSDLTYFKSEVSQKFLILVNTTSQGLGLCNMKISL